MADDLQPKDPATEGLERRLRVIAVGIMLLMVVLLVIVDTFGRLLNPDFRVSELFFGTLVSAILMLLGIAGINRLPGLRR